MSSAGPAPESPPPPPSDHLGDEEDINREKSQDPSPVYDLPEKFTSSCTQQVIVRIHTLVQSDAIDSWSLGSV